jgi:hypothetical protein
MMPKLTVEAMEKIKNEVERIDYGKVTLVVNENMPDIDVVVEERMRFPKRETPRPGRVVSATRVTHLS